MCLVCNLVEKIVLNYRPKLGEPMDINFVKKWTIERETIQKLQFLQYLLAKKLFSYFK